MVKILEISAIVSLVIGTTGAAGEYVLPRLGTHGDAGVCFLQHLGFDRYGGGVVVKI